MAVRMSRAAKRRWRRVPWILSATLAWMFAAILLLGPVQDIWSYRDSDHWPTAAGRVLESRAGIARSRGARLMRTPRIEYEFEVEGRRYQGHRYAVVTTSDNTGSADRIVSKHPVGSPVTISYDPSDPARSVILPGVGVGGWVLVGVGWTLPLVAMVLTAWTIHRWERLGEPRPRQPAAAKS